MLETLDLNLTLSKEAFRERLIPLREQLSDLQQLIRAAKIPVVVLTNIGDVETISKIVEAGAVDYLLKSDQSVDDIIQKVKDVLARSVKLS